MLCPTDLTAGGTWLGLNDRGVFAAITNRFGLMKDEARRSRGVLVLDALAHADARSACDALAALDPRKENAFHLAIADKESAFLIIADGSTIRSRDLERGMHVITERSFDAGPTTRDAYIREHFAGLAAPPSDAELEKFLGSHRDESFEGLCVHVPAFNYGTRSSTIVRFGAARSEVAMRFADGPPHAAPFVEIDTRAIAVDL